MKQSIRVFLLLFLLCLFQPLLKASENPSFSTAGFYELSQSGREVYNFDVAWRFFKGAVKDAGSVSCDDENWKMVSLPHGLEYLPVDAAGSINYLGEAWYRKHFTPDDNLKGKRLFLHFEAIMGKSEVWVNGQLLKKHYGGFLPVVVDVTDYILWGKENTIAVKADNSDDPSYPPGKAHNVLGFCRYGGIYRDCWVVAHNQVHITDPNFENEQAGGGLFVSYDQITEKKALMNLKVHLRNHNKRNFSGTVVYNLLKSDGTKVLTKKVSVRIKKGASRHFASQVTVNNPKCWTPETPYLYWLEVKVLNGGGEVVDGYKKRIGIRTVEFKGADGLWLNGKPYRKKLIGANRHQEFAVLGNAVPNNIHWRDAKKLRDAGMTIIRNGHYPQDPAFMDACDQLGLFVVVPTPGWQFWNKNPQFAQYIYSDIRNMVRRDRNHPSVFLWEPVLNETHYPMAFARQAKKCVEDEYPYSNGYYTASDPKAIGSELYPVQFSHPALTGSFYSVKKIDSTKTYYTREWGDNVDDWNSQNSNSRIHRSWGEKAMLVQAQHYANPSYKPFTCLESLYAAGKHHIGGTMWHAFDHNQGYHPVPFYGGVMDAFRQPKYSYFMFMSQRDPVKSDLIAETGPMVYIAHEMSPFSSADVTVYSNCDEVRLTVYGDGKQLTYKKEKGKMAMPSPIITFKGVYDFMENKYRSRKGKRSQVYMLAEGIMDGKVVAKHKVQPAGRPDKVVLWLDNEATDLVANGSDAVTVVAGIADREGNIKRLSNFYVKFTIEGEGGIMGDASVMANPAPLVWGTAPVLVQSTTKAGKIKIVAEVLFPGSQQPASAELEFESVSAGIKSIYDKKEALLLNQNGAEKEQAGSVNKEMFRLKRENERLRKKLAEEGLKKVEKQQEVFGE